VNTVPVDILNNVPC